MAAPPHLVREPGAAPRAGGVTLPSEPFSIVVLPDTQFYAQAFPDVFDAQTRWIATNREALGISLVLHEGDIVNAPEDPAQWTRAQRSLGMLDGVVPYALAKGNHDLTRGVSRVRGLMDEFFPASRFLRHAWFRETFELDDMDNTFLLVDMGGRNWVVLALEFGPRDQVLAWADGILRRHADLPAIIVTHAYLYPDNTRYDRRRVDQAHGVHEVALEGGSNDGEEIWNKLVSRHDNVLFVFSGHVPEDGVGLLTSRRPSGTVCHQMLANYQAYGLGGDGFMRILRFDPVARRMSVRTYSPYFDVFKSDPDNEFSVALD